MLSRLHVIEKYVCKLAAENQRCFPVHVTFYRLAPTSFCHQIKQLLMLKISFWCRIFFCYFLVCVVGFVVYECICRRRAKVNTR